MSSTVTITETRTTAVADAVVATDVRTTQVADFRACKRVIRERVVALGCKGWVLEPVTRVDVKGRLQAGDRTYLVQIEARYDEAANRLMEPTVKQRRYYAG